MGGNQEHRHENEGFPVRHDGLSLSSILYHHSELSHIEQRNVLMGAMLKHASKQSTLESFFGATASHNKRIDISGGNTPLNCINLVSPPSVRMVGVQTRRLRKMILSVERKLACLFCHPRVSPRSSSIHPCLCQCLHASATTQHDLLSNHIPRLHPSPPPTHPVPVAQTQLPDLYPNTHD